MTNRFRLNRGRRPSSQRRPLPDRANPDVQPSRDPKVCGQAEGRRAQHC
jgi:hypothetical protein